MNKAVRAGVGVFSRVAAQLAHVLDEAVPLLNKISEEQAAEPRAPGKWSRKQVLGHLIDSASNNHQRFTRAAIAGKLEFPGYDQDALMKLERFQEVRWRGLIEFWEKYNRFLVHLLTAMPASVADASCVIGTNDAVTLEWLASDYVEHLKHHLNQVVGKRWESGYKPNL